MGMGITNEWFFGKIKVAGERKWKAEAIYICDDTGCVTVDHDDSSKTKWIYSEYLDT